MSATARREMMRRTEYSPPVSHAAIGLWRLIGSARVVPQSQFARLTLPGMELGAADEGPVVYCAGNVELVQRKCVAIVGSRKVSAEGAKRARKLARELVEAGVVVISGLALGVDANAHQSAIDAGGLTIAVIGTPLDRAYPAENAQLQEHIWRHYLLVSPFREGSQIFKSNWPQRNKFMAALSDATVIIEASDTSGSLHQAAECQPRRLNRPLFIARSVIDDKRLTWPAKFMGAPNVRALESTADVLTIIGA